jgi:hypothetical protein
MQATISLNCGSGYVPEIAQFCLLRYHIHQMLNPSKFHVLVCYLN